MGRVSTLLMEEHQHPSLPPSLKFTFMVTLDQSPAARQPAPRLGLGSLGSPDRQPPAAFSFFPRFPFSTAVHRAGALAYRLMSTGGRERCPGSRLQRTTGRVLLAAVLVALFAHMRFAGAALRAGRVRARPGPPPAVAGAFRRRSAVASRMEAQAGADGAERDPSGDAASYTGVSGRANGMFAAHIVAKGVRHSLGTFPSAREAAMAYDAAAVRFHGSRALKRLNFPEEAGAAAAEGGGAGPPARAGSEAGSAGSEAGPAGSEAGSAGSAGLAEALEALERSGDDFPHKDAVRSLIAAGKLHRSWVQYLCALQRPSALALLPLLSSENALAFESSTPAAMRRPGTLMHWVLQQKRRYPDKLLLVRVGEFFETFGSDAVLMVEHAGLNPMGGRPRAGCPYRNIQQTLDALTAAGITVAVFEEVADIDAPRGPEPYRRPLWGTYGMASGRTAEALGAAPPARGEEEAAPAARRGAAQRIKRRVLSQVVSSSSSTYLYDLCLTHADVPWRENRPILGVLLDGRGDPRAAVELRIDEREARVRTDVSAEALRAAVAASGCAGPLYVAGPGVSPEGTPNGGGALAWWEGAVEPLELPEDLEGLELLEGRGHRGDPGLLEDPEGREHPLEPETEVPPPGGSARPRADGRGGPGGGDAGGCSRGVRGGDARVVDAVVARADPRRRGESRARG